MDFGDKMMVLGRPTVTTGASAELTKDFERVRQLRLSEARRQRAREGGGCKGRAEAAKQKGKSGD